MSSPLYPAHISDFEKRLEGVRRILEDEDFVWCCAPIYDEDGRVHVFYSTWAKDAPEGFEAWLTHSTIAHAVADTPEGPFKKVETVLKGTKDGGWRSASVHNPSIHKVGNRYALFFFANSDGTQRTKRAGLAISHSLDGPWKVVNDKPIIEPDEDINAWDGYQTTNPAYLQHPNGEHWIYYKSHPDSKHLRMIGVAMSDKLEGPYKKYDQNPVFDYTDHEIDIEDPYVFMEDGKFKMLIRDRLGVIDDRMGLYYESDDGLNWSEPTIGYQQSPTYFGGDIHRFERPQLLMKDGKPEYAFCALMGGRYGRSTGCVLKVHHQPIR